MSLFPQYYLPHVAPPPVLLPPVICLTDEERTAISYAVAHLKKAHNSFFADHTLRKLLERTA